ncbi:hypothetical protein [Streptomyces lydicus]|uniref:hypothetical protein n=1 Tax=Streptomyces lydicus TaxID=47763 RepID=UPI0013E90E3C|nr:hypothetical protein [Streptomyces lydicus]MCZ1012342.1 hypothetical protein [Streptomyces lydicus]
MSHTLLPLPDRAAAFLRPRFDQYSPGLRDGWHIISRNGRWAVVWDLADREGGETPQQAAKRLELAKALSAGGYAVSTPPSFYMVFIADRPHDAGPRYSVVTEDSVLGGLFGGPHIVMDTWTNVDMAAFKDPQEAHKQCAKLEREQTLADAVANSTPRMATFLTRADEILGDGFWFLRTEEHSDTDHRPPTVHERADALVDVANAVLRGAEFERTGRRVAYETREYDVAWCPKSSTPAVGYFPGRRAEDRRTPFMDAAIGRLVDAGLTPAVFGESVGDGAFMVEQEGFQVNSAALALHGSSRVWVSLCGRGIALAEHGRAVEVLREAGWTVSPAGFDDEGIHEAFPPAGTVVPRREGTTLGFYPRDTDHEHVQAAVSLLLSCGFNPAETCDPRTVETTHGTALEYDGLANGFIVQSTGQDDHVTVQFLIDGQYQVGTTTDSELHAYQRALTAGGFLGTYADGYYQISARRMLAQESKDVATIWEVLNQAGHARESLHLEGLRVRLRWHTGSVVVKPAGVMEPEERARRLERIRKDLVEAGGEPVLLSPYHLRVKVSPEAWEVPAGIGCNVEEHEVPEIRAALMTLEGNGYFGGVFTEEETDTWPPTGFHLFPTGQDGTVIVTAERDNHTGDPWAKEIVAKEIVAKQWEAHERYARFFEGAGWTVRLLGHRDETGGTLAVRAPGH